MTAVLEPAQDTAPAGLDQPVVLDEPGIYDDVPEEAYHADPVPGGSLSSSGARKLLPPSCPAIFEHDRKHHSEPNKDLDFGSAAHRKVLGCGPDLVVVDAKDWRTKAAQQAAEQARARGAIPLLPHQYERINAMAAALRNHEHAGALLDPADGGRPEQTLIWEDRSGVMCRARVDWMRAIDHNGRLTIVDYKTARSAEPHAIQRAVYEHGYHQQEAFYRAGLRALDVADEIVFLFIFQEKEPPYLPTVVELDEEAVYWGDRLNRKAIRIYQECIATGYWPSYTDGVVPISLPLYAVSGYEAAHARGEFDTTTAW
ncbi:PD-(D/E)XK nuclease-like domain-containing protein [Amycolatopsis thermophila]|uniref:Putative exodeoxyribonuclease 8 PDDEXK-like domain-containing protein n=1 Tax=Amycolatopsis thermophila TaxID=206084 RepID=A0ABU0EMY2_9PSEU|nr:PD-(D/E)XK nuclease-like domain-containing protein [Amycolatopsis thermophila]MDQ0376632.1 hypothetical protein [Amycolatopsis thermophila]